MKKLIILLVAAMPLWAFGQKAKIEFQETSFNYGTISETAGKAVHIFEFKNTGDAPLILTNVRAGCGCTTPEWNRQPIAPGASGSIKVSYDPRNRPGSFVKSVTVNSNASNSVVSLTIRGNVTRKPAGPYDNFKYQIGSVKFFNNSLNLGNILNTQQIERKVPFVNTEKKNVTVTATANTPAISVSVIPETLAKDEKGTLVIKYDVAKKEDWGFVNDHVDIIVNGEHKGNINVVGNIKEDFSAYNGNFEKAPMIELSEKEANLEHITPNAVHTHDFYIQNLGKTDLIIRKIKASDTETTVNVQKTVIKPGKKTKVTVTYKTQQAPKETKIVQLLTNDPRNPMLNYKLIAHIDQ